MSRETFEKLFPVPVSTMFVNGRYETVLSTGSRLADMQQARWEAWQASRAEVDGLREQLNSLRGRVAAIRKSDCGTWLGLGRDERGQEKRYELMRLLDQLYRTNEQVDAALAKATGNEE